MNLHAYCFEGPTVQDLDGYKKVSCPKDGSK